MEARKITIVATREQKKYVINSAAETLGDLKKDLRESGINYSDMTFMEGLTRTEMKDDNSLLPRDVQKVNRETGETTITNELVFMLTNTAKKIRSGAMTRSEAYNAIKANNLQAKCVAKFGKNFTMCKTDDLISLVEAETKKAAPKAAPAPKKEAPAEAPKAEAVAAPAAPATPSTPVEVVDVQAREAIKRLVGILEESGTLEEYEVNEVLEALAMPFSAPVASAAPASYKPSSASPYSDDEIDEMFRGLK